MENESALIWGPWQKELRKSFRAAEPILEKLPPQVDRLFLRYLLREQTWIAMKYPDADQRKIEDAWAALCRAIKRFLKVTFEKPSKELSDDLKTRRAAAEAAGTLVTRWPSVGDIKPSRELSDALKTYSDTLGLPNYNEVVERRSGGRPDAFWSDAIAFAIKDHFEEKTSSPNWSMISRLLKCAPSIRGISMEAEKIRQRLVKLQREEKTTQRFRPTVRQHAYEFKRLYTNWTRETPCPSLVHSSVFRDPGR